MLRRLLALASTIALALATPGLTSAQVSSPQELTVPPIAYRERILENGLRVYTVQSDSTPNVAVQVWYRVGGRDDPRGLSGFAHLFEHLMFKSTENMPAETMDRLTEDVGGWNTAYTWDDATGYIDVVPANHLQRVLWAEADRLKTLVLDEANFASERDVVKEEYRETILADPWGRLFYRLLPQLAFERDPYRLGIIGDLTDLDAATIEDVRSFHATYYRPDNAVLVIVGNFDETEVEAWVDQYFGPIDRPDREIPRPGEPDAGPSSPRAVTAYGPNVSLPVVLTMQRIVASDHADAPALKVMDAILARGRSSRLYLSLIDGEEVGAEILTTLDLYAEAGYAAYGAVVASGASVERVEELVAAELAKLRETPVTEAELREAKTELLAGAARTRETLEGLSATIAEAALLFGGADQPDRELPAIQAVTAEDVQRVARLYFSEATVTTIRYLDEEDRPADAPDMDLESTPDSSARPLAAVDAPLFALLPEAKREQPPAPGPVTEINVPETLEHELHNGLRVIIAPTGTQPLATARLTIGTGACSDESGRAGTAYLLASLLSEGTATRTGAEIASAAESLGADLGAGAGPDSIAVQASAPDVNLEAAAALLADMVLQPKLAERDFGRVRARTEDAYSLDVSEPEGAASLATPAIAFGDGPCGQPDYGSASTLESIAYVDVTEFYDRAFRPDNATLILTGKITEEAGLALAGELFGDWEQPAFAAPFRPVPAPDDDVARTILVDFGEVGQNAVVAVHRVPPRGDEERVAVELANSIFGGGFSSRLPREVRIKRGLAYTSGSSIRMDLSGGLMQALSISQDETAVLVAELTLEELGRLATLPALPNELDARKAALVGEFGGSLETTAGVAALLDDYAQADMLDAYKTYQDDVRAITAEEIQGVAQRWFAPETADLLVVGNAEALLPALEALRGPVEVVPFEDFDPAHSGLVRPER